MRSKKPVVFVGPYEHHSNEITWREGLTQVVEVDLETGTITGYMSTGAWPDGIAYSSFTRSGND